MENRIHSEIERRNLQSRDSWDLFEPHRRKITALIVNLGRNTNSRLCVLGAGNCNDLELPELLQTYREVHLVDFDSQALSSAVNRQQPAPEKKLFLHGGVDVTGVADLLAEWSAEKPPSSEEIHRCLEKVALFQLAADLPGPFDVVASDCLMTQLIDMVGLSLGEKHPAFAQMALTIRDRHLGLLLDLLSPGGVAVLITDVVSSETLPALSTVEEEKLPQLLSQQIQNRNFFTGANPFAIQSILHTDTGFSQQISDIRLLKPWRWNFGPRDYAVCALFIQKKTKEARTP